MAVTEAFDRFPGGGSVRISFKEASMWKKALIWLFAINLGVAFGAGVYELGL